jgi:hypothetical protein
MSYVARPKDFFSYFDETSAQSDTIGRKPGILWRISQALERSRQRETNRQIAAFLARSGGRFTDDIERELMSRVATGEWNVAASARRGF